ncbi:MAG: glycosyltransferase family 8 protein [Lachnospiraceae bacterium]|nr:glycosyltransferase family 8 protein [Lachnospiraceae bacterium]
MIKPRMNIAAALNSNYVRYTYVMLTSLFVNQDENWDIHIFLLQSDLTPEEKLCLEELVASHQACLHWLTVDRSLFSADYLAVTKWSMETFYRLTLQDILPIEVDRILYLDVDMIINKSLTELYTTDFEGNILCACPEPYVAPASADARSRFFQDHLKEGFMYFNAGMLLMNIEKMRGKYHLDTYLNLAKDLPYRLPTPDQDLLNYVHWKEVKFVDTIKYNLPARFAFNLGVRYAEVKASVTIIHFLGNKPWNGKCDHFDIEQLWWDYAEMTPFYQQLAEEYLG